MVGEAEPQRWFRVGRWASLTSAPLIERPSDFHGRRRWSGESIGARPAMGTSFVGKRCEDIVSLPKRHRSAVVRYRLSGVLPRSWAMMSWTIRLPIESETDSVDSRFESETKLDRHRTSQNNRSNDRSLYRTAKCSGAVVANKMSRLCFLFGWLHYLSIGCGTKSMKFKISPVKQTSLVALNREIEKCC